MKSVLQFIIASFFTLISHAQHHDFDSLQNWEGALLDFDWKKNEILLNQRQSHIESTKDACQMINHIFVIMNNFF